ncbi:hypothetical protein SAY87_006657 [Trapa incisa]|uniref:Protein kinase domain-containing protein n=1 Tax=Trapa incisa TaxID=236973 RepID=A0AAN7Q497_9MYRT|nr:hypothetical protein SAY87_006657 [Trapa incisa]
MLLEKKMSVVVFALYFLSSLLLCAGVPYEHIDFSPILQKYLHSPNEGSEENGKLLLMSMSYLPSKKPHKWNVKATLQPTLAPVLSPTYAVPVNAPGSRLSPKHHGHHRHTRPPVSAPPPLTEPGCGQICAEPLTSTPFGSPCGCVLPMKIKLLLDIASYAVFPVMRELEIEIAVGTYLKQSQVKIMGANADSQNQGRTVVDIDLVPLGEKFDNTTADLIYERFWHKSLRLNASLFGHYEVINIIYTVGGYTGSAPTESGGNLPFYADFHKQNHKMSVRGITLFSLSSFVLLLIIIGVLFIFLKRKKFARPSTDVGPAFISSINKRSGTMSTLSSNIVSSASGSLISTMAPCILSVRTFGFAELEKATEKFCSKRILGEGGFGRVYKGVMEDGSEVAVKLLTRDQQNGDREFIAEVEILSRLHHRNLVKLMGICIEGRRRCLVYEVVHNGSVESHLHGADKNKGPLDWESRMKIALGAARGLAYLHEDSNPRVIHRDFKASNVLLEHDFTPKISDFGLAREAAEGSQHISTRVMGTFGYVAPEYAMTGHLLVKSDVYSYGVVLLELITGRKPVDMSQPQGEENLVLWARPLLASQESLVRLVDPALAGTYDLGDMAKVAAIASMCVHPEVTHRPFMGEVVQALKLIYNDSDETCGDYYSQNDSLVHDSELKDELASSEGGWWNHLSGATPRLITMEDYSSGPLSNRANSDPGLGGDATFLTVRHGNRSGPLRTLRSKPAFYRLMAGSVSEHGFLHRKRAWDGGH